MLGTRRQPFLHHERRMHAFIGMHAANEGRQVVQAVQADLRADGPAQHHEVIGIGDGALAREPCASGELRIEPREVLAHVAARSGSQSRRLAVVRQVALGKEDRPERLVHIGVQETEPAHHLRPRARRTVASQLQLRMQVRKVAKDGDVLGQREVAIHKQRYCARRVERQVLRRLDAVAVHAHRLVRLAGPLEHDVIGQRTGAWHVEEFHGGGPVCVCRLPVAGSKGCLPPAASPCCWSDLRGDTAPT
ncbi:hypothetical protein D9M72_504680 [compost metagenome]